MNLYVGYTTTVHPHFHSLVPTAHAPKNYKDEEKIAEYEAIKQIELNVEAAKKPLTGALAEAVIMQGSGEVLKTQDTLLCALSEQLTPRAVDYLFVSKPSLFLRLAVTDHWERAQKPLDPIMSWALRSDVTSTPYVKGVTNVTEVCVIDPARVLLGSQADIGFILLISRFVPDMRGLPETAENWAKLNFKLATIIGGAGWTTTI